LNFGDIVADKYSWYIIYTSRVSVIRTNVRRRRRCCRHRRRSGRCLMWPPPWCFCCSYRCSNYWYGSGKRALCFVSPVHECFVFIYSQLLFFFSLSQPPWSASNVIEILYCLCRSINITLKYVHLKIIFKIHTTGVFFE